MWQKTVKPYVDAGELAVVGVVQEQHPDRALLYRQWRRIDWPIFVDALNLLDLSVVPIPVAIDASAIVRHERIRPSQFVDRFMTQTYPISNQPSGFNIAPKPKPDSSLREARARDTAGAWRAAGDAVFLAPDDDPVDRAIDAYQKAIAKEPADGRAHFRLGVALKRRAESRWRQADDAQRAVEHWGIALDTNPNQYIWRRRIEQYGPRLAKPYNFYFWVDEARKAIRARGDKPVTLISEPMGSEIAPPQRDGASSETVVMPDPDPAGRLARDSKGFVTIEQMVTPAEVSPGARCRVRLTFRLNEKATPYWNNEHKGLMTSIKLSPGMTLVEGSLTYPSPRKPETKEVRVIEFEIAVAESVRPGKIELPAYAVYDICEDERGICRHLRQDYAISLRVDRQ